MEKEGGAVSGEKPKGESVLNQKGLQSGKFHVNSLTLRALG